VERVARDRDSSSSGGIHELLERRALVHAGQLTDELAAKSDEKAGEDDGHRPASELKEALGHAKSLEHGSAGGGRGRGATLGHRPVSIA